MSSNQKPTRRDLVRHPADRAGGGLMKAPKPGAVTRPQAAGLARRASGVVDTPRTQGLAPRTTPPAAPDARPTWRRWLPAVLTCLGFAVVMPPAVLLAAGGMLGAAGALLLLADRRLLVNGWLLKGAAACVATAGISLLLRSAVAAVFG